MNTSKAPKNNKDLYRPKYHFSPPQGWLNDPNGFSFFRGEWHIFYQHNPHSTRWGRMHWGHAISNDLVNWRHLPIALKPDRLDNFLGCFSGSAIEHDNKLHLIYTGVPFFKQHQRLAISEDGINYIKRKQPIIGINNRPPFSKPFSFRDPKIIKHNNCFYMVIGASYKNGRQVALYKSKNLTDWTFIAPILVDDYKTKGIFECPDLIMNDNGDLLIYSVMYTKTKDFSFQNLHSSVYIIGKADLEKGTYEQKTEPIELDYGCDYYAPQTVTSPCGRTIIIAWMQMWFRSNPCSYLKYGYAGILTLPKELYVNNGVLYQKAIEEVYSYFDMDKIQITQNIKEKVSFDDINGECYRLFIEVDKAQNFCIYLREGIDCYTIIEYSDSVVTFNRENSGHKIKGALLDGNCNIRHCDIDNASSINMEIFVDKSSVEIIINNRYCMSNTIYPFENASGISFSSPKGITAKISFSPYKY